MNLFQLPTFGSNAAIMDTYDPNAACTRIEAATQYLRNSIIFANSFEKNDFSAIIESFRVNVNTSRTYLTVHFQVENGIIVRSYTFRC